MTFLAKSKSFQSDSDDNDKQINTFNNTSSKCFHHFTIEIVHKCCLVHSLSITYSSSNSDSP
uniref:Uncharacterized protein n=1 Tax=Onchocerca volvulus TaxID=6282 RepID=A0A8R1TQ86_ONCVO